MAARPLRRGALTPVLLLVCCLTALADDSPATDLKVNTDYLEKTWGIKYKSHKVENGPAQGQKRVKILLEFTEDAKDVAMV
jgi:hypothetical protein